MNDIAFLSNGHGEDTIACRVIDQLKLLRPSLSIDAWPMVGEGSSFAARGISTFGSSNLLPSSGFATISPKLMVGDLRAGWIKIHWRQYKAAQEMRGRYRFAVAVGDIIPITAAVVSKTPFAFIGCAKSYYYHHGRAYTPLERRLLRKHCAVTFPRDRKTIPELDKDKVPNLYLGNPMMDGLEGSGARFGIAPDKTIVGMLAGTRPDAEDNLLDLLAMAVAAGDTSIGTHKLCFVFAGRPELDPGKVTSMIAGDVRLAGWSVSVVSPDAATQGVVLRLARPNGIEALIVKHHFADVLHLSSIVVGMAGTANEQAIGLGKPLIAVPSAGVQGDHYVKMKQVYFGDAAMTVKHEPAVVAAAIADLLSDATKRDRMADAGRERMGEPGGSLAIAEEILRVLDKSAAKAAGQ